MGGLAPPPPEVIAAERAIAAYLDPTALREALTRWYDPGWRVVVVGRVSAGKSSLVNALAGRPAQPVGLGGVTEEPTELELGDGVVVVDTPGIDEPAEACWVLEPLLGQADSVIWVVDGLQPVTRSEREVLDEALPPGTAIHVVVARLDATDPTERGPVMERVEALSAPWSPRSVQEADLRTLARRGSPQLTGLLRKEPWPPVRRVVPVLDALVQALSAFEDSPRAVDCDGVHQTLRSAVRRTVVQVERVVVAGITTRRHPDRRDALLRFAAEARREREVFLASLEADSMLAPVVARHGTPSLPLPLPDADSPLDTVRDVMGGISTARRAVSGMAARWMLEADVALADWIEAIRADPSQVHAAARDRAREVVERAMAALQDQRGSDPDTTRSRLPSSRE